MPGPARTLLNTAAAPTLARIREDWLRTEGPARPLLAFLVDHLFDAELGLNVLQRRAGVHKSTLNYLFQDAVGSPPYTYIEDRRLETGASLLIDTDLRLWKIAELLGYRNTKTFRRAFERWSKLLPSEYRRERRQLAEDEPFAIDDVAEQAGLTAPVMLERCARGELEVDVTDILIERLRSLYPERE